MGKIQNIYWYIGISVISIGSAAYTICIKRHEHKVSALLAFFLFVTGLAWICEFVVLGLLNSYAYKTGVLENPWAENLLGHLLLNTTLYPSAAVITVTSSQRKTTVIICTVLFTLVDYIFVYLGLYEHHWWRYYMTTITVAVILAFSVFWFDRIKEGCRGFSRAFTFYFIALLIAHFPAPVLLLLGKQYYQLSIVDAFFKDFYLSSIIFIFAYHLLESILLVYVTCGSKKYHLKALPFIVSITAQSLFAALQLLRFNTGWNLLYTIILYEAFLGVFIWVEKHTLLPAPAPNNQL